MPLQLLQDLIRIPSVNPMGRAIDASICFESRLTDFLIGFFQELGVEYEVREIQPGRSNVLARIQGAPSAPVILFDAHQDTVPIDGMTIDPFDPVVNASGADSNHGARVFGRGACDIKGGMAAMLTAFARTAMSGGPPRYTVVMACTCDEEFGQLGAKDLCRSWRGETPPYRLAPAPPNLALVAEPTDLHAVVAHRGAVRWRIGATGRAAHSSDPSQGDNAIYRMAAIVRHLQQYADHLTQSIPHDPLCGPATFSVGIIQGGSSVNVVPDQCTIEVDRRLLPGETPEAAHRDARQFLEERAPTHLVVHPAETGCLPLCSSPENQRWAAELLQHVRQQAPDRQAVGVAYGTHAATYADYGAPSIVFGPGSIRQAHTKDEWLSIQELEQAATILESFLGRG